MKSSQPLFPQLKFYDMRLLWSFKNNERPDWPIVAPEIVIMSSPNDYDQRDDCWYASMTALFALTNSESVRVHWPVLEDRTMSEESFASFCRAQATYLEAQLFKLGVNERVFYFTLHKRRLQTQENVDDHENRYIYEILRHTTDVSVYQQVMRGAVIAPYAVRVK